MTVLPSKHTAHLHSTLFYFSLITSKIYLNSTVSSAYNQLQPNTLTQFFPTSSAVLSACATTGRPCERVCSTSEPRDYRISSTVCITSLTSRVQRALRVVSPDSLVRTHMPRNCTPRQDPLQVIRERCLGVLPQYDSLVMTPIHHSHSRRYP